MKSIFIFTVFWALVTAAQAQTLGVDKIEWNSSISKDGATEISSNNKFILYANDKIEWTQNDETVVYKITGITGEWSDLTKQGQVEYKVLLGSRSGSIFFYRNSTGIKVRIEMYRGNVNLVPAEFIISNYNKAN